MSNLHYAIWSFLHNILILSSTFERSSLLFSQGHILTFHFEYFCTAPVLSSYAHKTLFQLWSLNTTPTKFFHFQSVLHSPFAEHVSHPKQLSENVFQHPISNKSADFPNMFLATLLKLLQMSSMENVKVVMEANKNLESRPELFRLVLTHGQCCCHILNKIGKRLSHLFLQGFQFQICLHFSLTFSVYNTGTLTIPFKRFFFCVVLLFGPGKCENETKIRRSHQHFSKKALYYVGTSSILVYMYSDTAHVLFYL